MAAPVVDDTGDNGDAAVDDVDDAVAPIDDGVLAADTVTDADADDGVVGLSGIMRCWWPAAVWSVCAGVARIVCVISAINRL